jgi:hypothetical protein
MKIENTLMRGFYSGLIAGIIGGIAINITRIVEAILGLPSAIAGMLTVETMLFHLAYEMGQAGISGALVGILYARFYDAVPGKGVKKSLVFGSIIFLFSSLWWTSADILDWLLTWTELYFWWAFVYFLAIFVWIPYGVVLGLVYERWK